ncbi:MAG: hypothetical protein U9Q68_09195 [Euryarchaeota archaeon]|nr:hypothetical protein [Euryarchaeota archaeon]
MSRGIVNASATLAASIFHFSEYMISDARSICRGAVYVRLAVVSGNDASAVDRLGMLRDRKCS